MIYNKNIEKQSSMLGEDERILRILANREIEDLEKISMFLDPDLDKMYDPFLMKDMAEAVDLILDAVDLDEHIHIAGDYDQDGNSAIVILMKGLGALTNRLTYSIPDRVQDGYGLNKRLVDEAADMGAKVLITCDNGISAHEAVAYAKTRGLKVVVTDHHQVSLENNEQKLPEADAVINPHRLDCPYPFKELCGAGVAFKLVQAIYLVLGMENERAYELLEFACMGTICDIVDLVDENRIIAVHGLKRLNETHNLGVRYLALEAGWNKEINSYALGFVLGPCINASGRLSTARLGVELFLEEDENLVQNYAAELVRLNNERKTMTEEAVKKARDLVIKENKVTNQVIVGWVPDIHESIVGIVAGRIKDEFHRPTIIFTQASKPGILKGSARSISAYNMFEKVNEIKDLTVSFGGHEMAAGMSIRQEDLEKFERELNARAKLSDYDLQREISIDLSQPIDELDFYLIKAIEKLGPFGKANPSAKFADKNVRLLSYDIIGKNRNVLKLNFEKNGKVRQAISFSNIQATYDFLEKNFPNLKATNPRGQAQLDIIYKPEINEFNGNRTIQLRLEDLRLSR